MLIFQVIVHVGQSRKLCIMLCVFIRETVVMLQPTKCTNLIVVWCRFILIACDGLWKAFTVEAAAKFALSVIEVHIYILPPS